MRGLALLILMPLIRHPLARSPGEEHTVERSIEHGGLKRSFRLHVPPGLDKEKPAPLVLAFHGGGGDARSTERMSRFSALSDKNGFIVAYPQGVGKNWNDGRGAANLQAQKENVDDVGFIASLVETLSKEQKIDPKRVFATGISNGAIFSHTLAAKRSDLVAAIAPVVGGLAEPVAKDFKPEHPVSVLILQGTKDPLVPYEGGPVARNRGRIVPTSEAVKKWVEHNGCAVEPKTADLPDKSPEDGTRVKRSVHAGGKGGSEVVLYAIEEGGHTWPGGAQYLPERVIGKVCRDIDGSEVIWEFFASHGRP